jgi:hypothetical protein
MMASFHQDRGFTNALYGQFLEGPFWAWLHLFNTGICTLIHIHLTLQWTYVGQYITIISDC